MFQSFDRLKIYIFQYQDSNIKFQLIAVSFQLLLRPNKTIILPF